ncbi:MAG: glycosyltransferase family 4 protein [Ignavibacteria bacterium]
MRIAFDGRVLERSMTGIGRYLINILEEIPFYDQQNEYFIFTNKPQNHIRNNFYHYATLNKPFINSKIFTPVWLNLILPSQLIEKKIDLLIGPNILVPTKEIKNLKKISIVHDIMPLTHPEFFPFSYKNFLRLYLPSSIQASDLIITISNTSKKYICDYFGVDEAKVKVVYNTVSDRFRKLDLAELEFLEKKSSLMLPPKFLLYVGVLEKRKNIKAILEIAKRIDLIDKELKIVLAGKQGFGFEVFEKELFELIDKVIWLKQVNDEELLLLYNKAFIFLFPSFVEGFGLPPIEAMACGTPVIASNCDALREILNSSAFLHNPNDVDGMIGSIIKLNSEKDFYNEMCEKSIQHSKIYSKENMIKSFFKVINTIKKKIY